MRAESDKMRDIAVNYFIHGANISGNVNAAKTEILPFQRMIVQHRIKRVVFKKNNLFSRANADIFSELLIRFFEFMVKENFHFDSR